MDSSATPPRFAAIVPVKRPALGKSRLAVLGDAARADLVTAFAFDTVTAVAETPGVALTLVVTDDAHLASQVLGLGATVIPDGGSELNDSLVQAAAEVSRRDPGLALAVVCADLPGLTPSSLGAVLRAAPIDRASFVPDAEGSGSTVYLAPEAAKFEPHFGPDSARAHRDGGAVALEVTVEDPIRRDVDTPDDLEALRVVGLGPHTRIALTRHRI